MDLSKLPRTQLEFEERFRTEEACVEFLRDERWADGFRCPKCEGTKAWRLASRPLDECVECGHQVSLIAGTVFQGTRKPLRLWFRVIGQFVTSKSGCSATDVERQQGIHYQTAWTWLHKLRSCISQSGRAKLQGSVEVDESYVGGEDEPAHTGRSLKGHKTVVVAAAEWKDDAIGRIRAEAVPNATANSVCGFVEGNVAKGSTVKTDGFQGYVSLNKRGYVHNREVIGNPKRAAKAMPHIHRRSAFRCRPPTPPSWPARRPSNQPEGNRYPFGVLSNAARTEALNCRTLPNPLWWATSIIGRAVVSRSCRASRSRREAWRARGACRAVRREGGAAAALRDQAGRPTPPRRPRPGRPSR